MKCAKCVFEQMPRAKSLACWLTSIYLSVQLCDLKRLGAQMSCQIAADSFHFYFLISSFTSRHLSTFGYVHTLLLLLQ